jgi:hypothetical protein
MRCLPSLRFDEKQWAHFPYLGPAVGLTSCPQHRVSVGGREIAPRSNPPPKGTLVISGSIFLVKKGVSGNAN